MPKPINDYFERYVSAEKPGIPGAKTGELSIADFSLNAGEILKEGVAQEQSMDYVTGRLQKLITANPELAKQKELPTDFQAIKTQFVEPYYKESTASKNGFDLSKTADCLTSHIDSGLATMGFVVAALAVPNPVAKAVFATIAYGTAATQVAACIQDGTETE